MEEKLAEQSVKKLIKKVTGIIEENMKKIEYVDTLVRMKFTIHYLHEISYIRASENETFCSGAEFFGKGGGPSPEFLGWGSVIQSSLSLWDGVQLILELNTWLFLRDYTFFIES